MASINWEDFKPGHFAPCFSVLFQPLAGLFCQCMSMMACSRPTVSLQSSAVSLCVNIYDIYNIYIYTYVYLYNLLQASSIISIPYDMI